MGDVQYGAQTIENWAKATRPGRVAASGKAFNNFGEGLHESLELLYRTAQDLAEVWGGEPSATAAQTQLQQLYVSAKEIGEASKRVGGALRQHGEADLPKLKAYFSSSEWTQIKNNSTPVQITGVRPGPGGSLAPQYGMGSADEAAANKLGEHNGTISAAYTTIPKWYSVTLPVAWDRGGHSNVPTHGPTSPGGGAPSGSPRLGGGGGKLPGGGSLPHPHVPKMPTPSDGTVPSANGNGTQLSGLQPGGGTPMPPGLPSGPTLDPGIARGPLSGGAGPGGGVFSPGVPGPGYSSGPGVVPPVGGRGIGGAESAAEAETAAARNLQRGAAGQVGMVPSGGAAGDKKERQRTTWMSEDEETWQPSDIPEVPGLISRPPATRKAEPDEDLDFYEEELDL
ncbi:WXG100 family type VII secretion target [Actinoallomurus vinaceus]|uniref:WXG100 family type VII secretion target n=1 Tax=Actinoallomurus vinaceus TaxID=1080074 RepID=UPI0031E6BEAD